MDEAGALKREPVTLYRGFGALKYKELPFLRSIDEFAEHIFNEPFPGLCSTVAARYNADEAYKRYREMETSGKPSAMKLAMIEHFRGEREFSFFATATENEEQAVFFAGTSWKDNPFGLVVRFRRDHDYEIYSPTENLHPYREVLLASRVEPVDIDKILVVGCKAPNHMLIEFVYKRGGDGRVRKFRNPNHREYTYLRGVMWTPETFFTPPIKSTQEPKKGVK
jgi:hypothetical protein